MRRFFRGHRDEDYSQIQYLTAKCTRLAYDKAVLDREFLMSRDRERKLQNDLEAATARLLHQQQLNMELRMREDQLISRIHQQQSSEVKLEGLVEELHAEAQHRAVVAESLQTELHSEARRRAALTESLQTELRSKTVELEELQDTNQTLTETLKELRSTHQKEVRELQQENQGSLRKLQGTAEQFEWLCQQQRYWMCCVKKFKDCLMEERDALLRQVIELKKKVEKHDDSPTQSVVCPLQDTQGCDGSITSWDADAVADLESQVEKSNMPYAELFNQAGSPINGYQKPP
ncbi:uncharacterized protein LOC144524074 isoform X3 [Sander vitreus]